MSAFDQHIGHRAHFRARPGSESTLRAGGFEVEDLRGAGLPCFNMYRLAVIARGEKLIEDASEQRGELPLGAPATMYAFSWLFPSQREQDQPSGLATLCGTRAGNQA